MCVCPTDGPALMPILADRGPASGLCPALLGGGVHQPAEACPGKTLATACTPPLLLLCVIVLPTKSTTFCWSHAAMREPVQERDYTILCPPLNLLSSLNSRTPGSTAGASCTPRGALPIGTASTRHPARSTLHFSGLWAFACRQEAAEARAAAQACGRVRAGPERAGLLQHPDAGWGAGARSARIPYCRA